MQRSIVLVVGVAVLAGPALGAPASAAVLRVLYPRFDSSGYRAEGRRVGWTQVQPWRDDAQVVLVEHLEQEGGDGPSRFELAVLRPGEADLRVVARHVGWEGLQSTERCGASLCPRKLIGLDLADFEFCPDQRALGVVLELTGDGGSVRRELELWRVHEGGLALLVRVPLRAGAREGKVVFLRRRDRPCRDLQLRERGGAEPDRTRLFRWTGERYEEGAAQG